MILFVSAVIFVLFLVTGYFVLENATRSQFDAIKVFAGILFALLILLALVTLFAGIWITLAGTDAYYDWYNFNRTLVPHR
ncbi:MAG: hypothetical protein AABZ39_06345 [Spirochaetota bacterium]